MNFLGEFLRENIYRQHHRKHDNWPIKYCSEHLWEKDRSVICFKVIILWIEKRQKYFSLFTHLLPNSCCKPYHLTIGQRSISWNLQRHKMFEQFLHCRAYRWSAFISLISLLSWHREKYSIPTLLSAVYRETLTSLVYFRLHQSKSVTKRRLDVRDRYLHIRDRILNCNFPIFMLVTD